MALSLLSYVLLGLLGWVAYEWYTFMVMRNKLASIPTIGSDSFLLSYVSAWKFVWNGWNMIQEGYEKYPNGLFKVPTLETSSRWLVVATGDSFVRDIKEAKFDVLSTEEAGIDLLQTRYMVEKKDVESPAYHQEVIRNGLTRNLSALFSDIVDEIVCSFNDHLPATEDWTGYPIRNTLLPIVSRTSNRLFIGKPLCRERGYLEIQEKFAVHIMIAASIINLCPGFLKSVVGWMITQYPKTFRRLEYYLQSILKERLRMDAEYGKDWDGRPNDLFSWCLDVAPPQSRNVHDLILRLMGINFAAIHTTSITLSNALLELASRPEYIDPLRREIEGVIAAHGWTKESIGKMQKLDSFIKESTRVAGIMSTSLLHKATKDFSFSDGRVVPAGATVAAATGCIHRDSSIYESAEEFRGFRFSDRREDGTDEFQQFRYQMVTPTKDYLLFGWGKHACPGRFFAVNEVKCMVAYVVMNYDIKLPEIPNSPPTWLGTQRIPSGTAQILFRKRQH